MTPFNGVRDHNGSLYSIPLSTTTRLNLIDSFQNGTKQTLGMLDVIVTFQNGAEQNEVHAGCYFEVPRWRRFGTDTSCFLDFSRLEHAQAAHENTEHQRTQLGSVSLVDAIKKILGYEIMTWLSIYYYCYCFVQFLVCNLNLNPHKVTTELPVILEMLLNVSIFTELKGNDIVLKLHDEIINV